MSHPENEKHIDWATVTMSSNIPQRPGPIYRAYQRMLPNEQEQFERNLVISRKSAKENAKGIQQFESSRIKGITPEEAHFAASLLEQMSPCEAIHFLYYGEHAFRNAPVPAIRIGHPSWNAVRGKPLNDLNPSKKMQKRGMRLFQRRERRNILEENPEEYTEDIRMIRYIASLYNLNPDACIMGYRSEYNRPNNLPQNVPYGRMENFLRTPSGHGGRRLRCKHTHKHHKGSRGHKKHTRRHK